MSRPRKLASTRSRPLAVGYIRVSTVEQVDHGASLDAQRAALTGEAERRSWDLELVADEGLSGKTMNRPALLSAIERLDRGEADTLMAIRLDRVSRSVADFAGLLDRAVRRGWGLVLLSPALDLADPAGRFTANVLASAAQYDRELIGARTREGMAQRRAEGVHLGRPRTVSDAVIDQIARSRNAGLGWSAIAKELNSLGIATCRGGLTWYPATVRKIHTTECGSKDLPSTAALS